VARRIGGGASVNGHDIRDIRFAGSGRPAGPLIENAVLRTRFSWQEVRVVANRPARALAGHHQRQQDGTNLGGGQQQISVRVDRREILLVPH